MAWSIQITHGASWPSAGASCPSGLANVVNSNPKREGNPKSAIPHPKLKGPSIFGRPFLNMAASDLPATQAEIATVARFLA